MKSFAFRLIRLTAVAILALLLAGGPLSALDRELVISTYQGACRGGEFSANLKLVREVVREALGRNSDFVVFPETFLSGYDTAENVRRGARRVDDPELAAFIAESAQHRMTILVGIARLTAEGIYNSVLVIEGGRLLGIHDKVMLTEGDRDDLKFIAGNDIPVFATHGTRIAVSICHDTSFPHPALVARMRGAEILFTPHYNSIYAQGADGHRIWVRNCHVGLATMMKMAVVRSNVVVTDVAGEPGFGDSFIMSPQGEILAGAGLFRTGLATAVLKPEMFQAPFVWADLNEVPAWLKTTLANELTK